ncbi:MAG: hypothetical protein ACRDFQ_03460 [Anaerolineales bacterium]
MAQLVELVERNRRKGESDFAVCKRLAPRLSAAAVGKVAWSPNYPHQVLRGKIEASNRFWAAVRTLSDAGRMSSKKPQLTVSFESREEMEFVRRYLPPWKRRRILLRAIGRRPGVK